MLRLFSHFRWFLYERKPFQTEFVSRHERLARSKVLKDGLRSEFWKILKLELEAVLRRERDFACRQLALGNDSVAKDSAMLAEAVLKIMSAPESVLQHNVDVLPQDGRDEDPRPEKQEERTSRFTDKKY